MSQHVAEVVEISFEKHPNADALSIVKLGGFQVVVNTAMWEGATKGIYILPDSVVDVSRPEFAFLNKGRPKERIKCVRLRGEFSQGLLIPAPEGAEVGQDFWNELGLEWYEPELALSTGGNFLAAPPAWGGLSKYDVENGRSLKIQRMFVPGEDVYVTAKLNGANCSFVFSDGKMNVRSRSGFRADEDNMFWAALRNTPAVEQFCIKHPDTLVYGEAYGNVKGFKYDCENGEVKFRVFDIMRQDRTFFNFHDLRLACNQHGMVMVPVPVGIHNPIPFDIEQLLTLAEGPCPLGNPIPEGIVVKPVVERRCGNERVMMKIVSNKYLEKS
jgi:RNA ligase (TIGR02306 family)